MGFCLNLGFTGFKGTPSLRTAGRKGSLIVDFKITEDMVGGQGCTLSEFRAKVLEFLLGHLPSKGKKLKFRQPPTA